MSSCLRSLLVRPVERDELDEFKALLRAHHWLGYCMSGPPMRYVAELDGAWVALATFGSAVLRCPVREDHIGWSPRQRAERLQHVVRDQRFCVLPAGRVPNLASAVLGRILRRIDGDYRRVHGLAVLAVETFTDPSRHAGTCYAAAGFVRVGATEGYGRRRGVEHYTFHGQPKTYWLRPLHPDSLAVLAGGFPSPLLCDPPRRGLIELNVVEFGSLRRHLARVGDGRKARGIRHGQVSILLIAVCALLSNNLNYTAIGEYAARLPQEALTRLGARYHPRKKRHIAPSESAIRRTIQRLDADELDAAVAAWVREQLGIGTLSDSDLPRGGLRPVDHRHRAEQGPQRGTPHLRRRHPRRLHLPALQPGLPPRALHPRRQREHPHRRDRHRRHQPDPREGQPRRAARPLPRPLGH